MSKDKDKEKANFINSNASGTLDEGLNEGIKLQWTDSVSTPATKYTLDKKKEENKNKNK